VTSLFPSVIGIRVRVLEIETKTTELLLALLFFLRRRQFGVEIAWRLQERGLTLALPSCQPRRRRVHFLAQALNHTSASARNAA
jgi:hypothetical protein